MLSTFDPSKAAKVVCYHLTPESPPLVDLRVSVSGRKVVQTFVRVGEGVRSGCWLDLGAGSHLFASCSC